MRGRVQRTWTPSNRHTHAPFQRRKGNKDLFSKRTKFTHLRQLPHRDCLRDGYRTRQCEDTTTTIMHNTGGGGGHGGPVPTQAPGFSGLRSSMQREGGAGMLDLPPEGAKEGWLVGPQQG